MRRFVSTLPLLLFTGLASGSLASSPLRAQETEAAKFKVTSSSPEAIKLFWAGVHDGQNITFTRAGERLSKALELDPAFGLARMAHAAYAVGLNRAEREAEFERGLADLAAASTEELLVGLAWRSWRLGEPVKARKLFGVLREMLPGEPWLAYQHAMLAGIEGGAGQIVNELGEVIEQFPDFAASYNNLAYMRWYTGDQSGALESVKTYVSMMPDHPNAYDSYAELHQWAGHYSEAIKHYEKANELMESYAWYTGLADAYQLAGEGEKARKALTRAAEIAVTPAQRLNIIRASGISYLLDGQRDKAIETFLTVANKAEAEGLSNLAAQAYQHAAVTDVTLGDGQAAEGYLAKFAALVPEDAPGLLAARALVHGTMGNADKAHEMADRLAEVAPGPYWESGAHILRGFAYIQQGDAPAAEAELAQANAENLLTKTFLAVCYQETGRQADAVALRDDVLGFREATLFNVEVAVARIHAARI
jgi:tetratricopeptide (TPR) repeat protein